LGRSATAKKNPHKEISGSVEGENILSSCVTVSFSERTVSVSTYLRGRLLGGQVVQSERSAGVVSSCCSSDLAL